MDENIQGADEAPPSGQQTIPEHVWQEARELARGAEVVPDGVPCLAARIWRARQQGKTLRVKLGVDPTGSQLHLGHTVVLRRLRRFQDFGHQAVLIIGGFTARIGDPTGRNASRPALSAEAVAQNAAGFLQQVCGIVQMDTLEVRNNSDWFASMNLATMLQLAAGTTVNRLIAKEQFGQRLERQQPVWLHELFYPLLQGHDSLVVQADVEIGGTDQRFNILQGRELQQQAGVEPQIALMLPILEGTDGKQKMSKTFDNSINLSDSASDVFAKVMRLPDQLILKFLELATSVSGAEVQAARDLLDSGTNPMLLKLQLGRQIVQDLHGDAAAQAAQEEWQQVHSRGEAPSTMPSLTVAQPQALVALLVSCGFATSNTKARELVRSGAVTLDGQKVQELTFTVSVPAAGASIVLKAGKRQFIRLVPA